MDAPVTIVTSHFNEDLSWLRAWEGLVVVVDKVGAAPTCFEPLLVIPNTAREASAYVAYIVFEYDRLPDRVAFIHGHEHAWHQCHTRGLLDVIRGANPACGFVPLNNLFNHKSWMLMPIGYESVCTPIGAQFVVQRARIRARPHAVWVKLLKFLTSPCTYPLESYQRGLVLEVVWHALFGEPKHDMVPRVEWFDFEYFPTWWCDIPQGVVLTYATVVDRQQIAQLHDVFRRFMAVDPWVGIPRRMLHMPEF